MDRNIKSRGRKKYVTSGGGNAKKRGDRLNSSVGVGGNTGYSGKHTTSSSSSQRSSSRGVSALGGMSLKRLLFLGVIVLVGYFILNSMGLIDGSMLSDFSTGYEQNVENQPIQQTGSQSTEQLPQGILNTNVSDDARSKYTDIKGNSKDVYTLMIYMCGTDLESRAGMATADLNEMLNAEISDNVNIIIETGGTKTWQNSVISNRTNQRYQCLDKGLKLLEGDIGKKQMTDPDTLSDFIKYSVDNFPADRYSLILWDHGGGSNQGYGYDEYAPGQTMTLGEIDKALKDANCKFDFVGFDACLMATFETALMLEKHADYLIASEETEPGIGWYYTNWLTNLSNDTSMSTLQIGKTIIDDFVQKCYEHRAADKTTLSIVDLADFSATVPKAFTEFAMTTSDLIEGDNYKIVSDARARTKEFGVSAKIDQIDLVHLAQHINTQEAEQLIEVIAKSVKYNKTSNTIANANGMSIYFPYKKLSNLAPMIDTYADIGMDEEYTDCIKNFANLEVGGQALAGGETNPFDTLLGQMGQTGSSVSSSDLGGEIVGELLNAFIMNGGLETLLGARSSNWVDPNAILDSTNYYESNNLTVSDIVITEEQENYVLSMSDEKWDLVQTLALNVFLDDGEGFIDLGLDNVYEFNDDGLIIDYDKTWIAINGQIVTYYLVSEDIVDGNYIITGRVPAKLNGELVNLILVFDDNNPRGKVIGAKYLYPDSPDTISKGLIEINIGDKIDFLCDYYTYDEKFQDSYYIGDQMIVQGELEISNVPVGDNPCIATYKITDIYNNNLWTPAITY